MKKTLKISLIVVLIAILSPLAVKVVYRLASSKTPQFIGQSFTRINTDRKLVALTYDDGPAPPYTDSILSILQKKNVKASFFLIGRNAQENYELSQRIHEQGHEIGNHTWSHRDMIFKSPSFIKTEIEKTDSLIRSLGYTEQIFFRSPRGMKLILLPWYLHQNDRVNVLFDVVPIDWENLSCKEMLDRALASVKEGSIILLHDGGGDRNETVELTSLLIDSLHHRGYEFATITELLNAASPGLKIPNHWGSSE